MLLGQVVRVNPHFHTITINVYWRKYNVVKVQSTWYPFIASSQTRVCVLTHYLWGQTLTSIILPMLQLYRRCSQHDGYLSTHGSFCIVSTNIISQVTAPLCPRLSITLLLAFLSWNSLKDRKSEFNPHFVHGNTNVLTFRECTVYDILQTCNSTNVTINYNNNNCNINDYSLWHVAFNVSFKFNK